MKEKLVHLLAGSPHEITTIVLAMLPAYWFYWKKRPEQKLARTMITLFLALTVWFGFVIGHIVNNVRGFI